MATAAQAWEHTAYKSDRTNGPALVCVEPDRLLIELALFRLIRTITRRPAAPIEIRAQDVVSLEIVTTRSGALRCHVVSGHGFQRHEHWLSAWVGDRWARLASDLPPITTR